MAADHRIVAKRHSKPPIPHCSLIDLGPAMGWRSAVMAAYDLIAAASASLPDDRFEPFPAVRLLPRRAVGLHLIADRQPGLLSLLLV